MKMSEQNEQILAGMYERLPLVIEHYAVKLVMRELRSVLSALAGSSPASECHGDCVLVSPSCLPHCLSRRVASPAPSSEVLQMASGVPIRFDPTMPRDEIRFENARGEVVGSMKVAPVSPAPEPETGVKST